MIVHVGDGRIIYGVVLAVHPNGAFVGETDEHGNRTLSRQVWCSDDQAAVEEVNGESLFDV